LRRWAAGEPIDAPRQQLLEELIVGIRADNLEKVFSQRIGACIKGCRLRPRTNFMSGRTNRYRYELVVTPAAERATLFFKKMANDIIFESPQLQQMEHKARKVMFALWDSCWANYVAKGPRVINILPPRVGRLIAAEAGRGRQGASDLRLAGRSHRRNDRAHLPAAVRSRVRQHP
jgi:dGTPase